MKITVEVEVFDDPEYCCSEEGSCAYLGRYSCLLFRGNLGNATRLDETDPERKCPQCKEACKTSSNEDIQNILFRHWRSITTLNEDT